MNFLLPLLSLALAFPIGAAGRDPDRATAKLGAGTYQTVKTAERFTIGGVGFAGTPSKFESAFRQLLEQPKPAARCQKLLIEATPSGQFYGLLGLCLLDKQAFQAALPRYRRSKANIPTMSGCIVTHIPAAKLAKKIEKGELR